MTVSPASAELTALGDTVRLSAEVRDQRGAVMPSAEVSWSTSDDSVVSVDGSGLATARGNGSATITAASGSASGTAAMTVAQAAASVSVSPPADTLVVGDTVRLSAAAADANGYPVAVPAFAWTSSDASVAAVDSTGLVTGVGEGAATITAVAGSAGGTAAITVERAAPVPAAVTVAPMSAELTALGGTVLLSAEVRDQYGAAMPAAAVTWSTSDRSVAAVDASGLVTAAGNGTATITAASGSASGTAAVTVAQAAASVSVSPPADTLVVGDTVRLSAVAADARGHPVAVAGFAWTSSDASVAVVDSTGLVTGVGEGAATISAAVGSASGGAAITVEPPSPVPASITVRPESIAFTALGDSVDLVAEVRDQNGHLMPNESVTWFDLDGRVATIRATGTQTGRATATGAGHAVMVARAGDHGATFEVSVRQALASVDLWVETVQTMLPGASVRAAGRVRDRNRYGIPDVPIIFRVEEGGGAVEPDSAITDAQGRSEVSWTMGASATQVLSVTADTLSDRFSSSLCNPLVLGTALPLGEPRVVDSLDSACGVSVEAPEAGTYYRATLVSTADDGAPDHVALTVLVDGQSAGGPAVSVAPVAGLSVPNIRTDPRADARERDRSVFSWMARPDGPRPLPDLAGTPAGRPEDPPATHTFTWGRPGTVEDNCTVGRTFGGVLLAHNEDIAIYADASLSSPISPADAQVVADMYEKFGAPTIRTYFGGVGDVDGNGRVLVLVQEVPGGWGFVWAGNLFSREDCPASNQAELIYIDERLVRSHVIANAPRTVIHEAKHVSSHHQNLRRAEEAGRDFLDTQHPTWIEEGTAEIAAEVAARLAWESIGGPAPNATVRGSDVRGPHGHALHMWTPEVIAVKDVLEAYGVVIATQPNSITHGNPYGAGWGFFRFLGDWIGGAGRSRFGDAALFARLNDAATPLGIDGIREVTGRTFEELVVEYAQAVSLAGTGVPEIAGVPRFSTYDMTGLNGRPFRSYVLTSSRFPYPVTLVGWGHGAPLWRSLAEPTTIAGLIGPNGFRVHDFRAESAGDKALLRVTGPRHVRLIVTRLPDQMGR